MCLAVAGKLLELNGSKGRALVRGNTVNVEMGIVQADVGDYVLIHAGCAISKVLKSEAEEMDALLNLVDDYDR